MMLKKIRSFLAALLIKTPVRIALGILVAYLAFAWLAFEPLVKWAAPKFVADKSQHHLSLSSAKFDPLALSLEVKDLKLTQPNGAPLLGFERFFVNFDATSLFKWAYAFDEIRLTAPTARVELLANGQLNWSALIEAFKSEEDEPDKPMPRLFITHFALEKGRVEVADQRVGFETAFNPLDLTLDALSTLPDDKGAYDVAATTQMGARIRWKGDVVLNPTMATGEVGIDQISFARLWPYLKDTLNMAPPEGTADMRLTYRLGWANKQLSLAVNDIAFHLNQLALRSAGASEAAVALESLSLTGGQFDLDKRSLEIGGIALNGGQINLKRDATGQLDVMDWFKPAKSVKSVKSVKAVKAAPAKEAEVPAKVQPEVSPQEPVAAAEAGAPWRVNLASFTLDGLGVRFADAGFSKPLMADVGNIKLAFNAKAEAGGAQTQASVQGLGLDIGKVRLTSGTDKSPFFTLDAIHVNEGEADLASQAAKVSRVVLQGGRLDVTRSPDGKIALMEGLQPVSKSQAPASDAKAITSKNQEDTPPAWKYNLGEFALADFAVNVRDEGISPAVQMNLQRIAVSVKDISENMKAALPVKLALQVKQGGAFQADGKVIPAKASADLRLQLKSLALSPAQPYLSQAANLTLVSGKASAQGRLKYDGAPQFVGGFQVDDLLLNESEGGARFLAWKTLSSDSVRYTPAAFSIEELKLDSLGAKLVIDKDKTVNLKKILKASSPEQGIDRPIPPPTGEHPDGHKGRVRAAVSPLAEVTSTATRTPTPATRFTIDRVRVENGELDFADLSLALPFGTRIHGFKGAFNGISTQPGTTAQLELDGQVDEYGLARAVGQLDLFDPTAFMDIKVVFKNVEMNSLTPYTATFAGRKISSGKLSLDLEYKIKARQLLGENQIIMDKLTLGERVESPTAKNLPLDLAIAILQDSDGRIDLGLPVSGSLDDPQFSYSGIIWKAIGNVLTKIVTAPFRALASLFGGNGEKLEKIAFEAGEVSLTPPEKEKFKQIAQILGKRPGLGLTVHPAWSAEIDRPVVKETRLRRAVAEKMGLKLKEDEEPGPLSTANPKAQAALEALYAARMGESSWKALQAKWVKANPEANPKTGVGKLTSRLQGLFKKDEPLSETDMAQLKGADLHALLYDQLLAKEQVSDADLAILADKRGRAILQGLTALGAPAERIKLAASEVFAGEGREIPARMELGVAGKGAAK
jgi:uncharacterized protein involved in outer membrane biogenesis